MNGEVRFAMIATVMGVLWLQPARAQFSSGSNGSDGALSYTTPGTFDFDPVALGLNAAGDNVFNFTTITIGSNVTLRLRASLLRNRAVVFLASGDVTVNGNLSLDGAEGNSITGLDWVSNRVPADPGPGGYPGGVGARPNQPNQPGGGPGAGVLPSVGCMVGVASYATPGGTSPFTAGSAVSGTTYGGVYLIPLLGGSGGSGGCLPASPAADAAGGNGGAGGGAIRIVSSTSISIFGSVSASGGSASAGRSGGGPGAPGSGGAIYLVAPAISAPGALSAAGGGFVNYGALQSSGDGRILLSGNTITTSNLVYGVVYKRPLFNPPLPATPPAVQVTSVGGVAVPANPHGVFQAPDIVINTNNSVAINIAAQNIPLGTAVKLYVASELAADQTVTCSPLAGTIASSTASCTATFPTSVSRLQVRVIW